MNNSMNEVRVETTEDVIRVSLSGRIVSENAEEIKNEVLTQVGEDESTPVEVDMEGLRYISSAGLRVILLLRKKHPDMKLINVRPAIYDILETTGFTEMMEVRKGHRRISVDDAVVIGRGANGTLYRISDDNVVKVFNSPDSLEEIMKEREVARLALVLGIPTAISFDIVKVGDSYGSVYEMLDAKSFSKVIAEEPDKLDWCVTEYVNLLKKIHGTEVPEGKLPDMKETVIDWAEFMKDYLPAETSSKLMDLVKAVPQNNHMIHGDYHTKNVQLTGDEVLLIDLDTLAVGDPVFEFASIFNAYVGFSELDPNVVVEFQGCSAETAREFWHKVLVEYFGTEDPEFLRDIENKARVVGYTRLIRRSIRRNGLEIEERRKEIDHWTKELIDLVAVTDRLSFT